MPGRVPLLKYGQLPAVVAWLLMFFAIHPHGAAQTVQGSILGSVRDSRGAVVAGATVTLTNTDEGAVRTAATSDNGDYQFLDVKAAHYTLTVTASGFDKWTTTGVEFAARQQLRIDATLAVGGVQQSVQVSGENASAIETESPQISVKFGSDQVIALPMNFRASSGGTSALALVAALPNVDYQLPYSTWKSITVAGSLTFQTQVDADGVTIGAVTGNHPLGDLLPVADAIAEIHSDGVLNTAEQPAPGEITFTTKSGTNQLHGGAWWYHQDSALNATPYGATTKPHLVGNTFGAMLSGPVVIPHLYNGHDRSFFWFDYEGFRFPRTSPEQYTVPTQAMMQGDFTNYIIPDQNGNNTFQGLVNPATGQVCGYTFAACGFSINSAAQALAKFYPTPNHSATANLANGSTMGVGTNQFVSGQTPNYWLNYDTSLNSNQFDVRGDQYLGSNQKLLVWGRLVWKNFPSSSPQGLDIPNSTNLTYNRNVILSANYTVNSHMIDEFRFGYARYLYGFVNPLNGTEITNGLGLQGLQNLWQNNLPYISPGSGITDLNTSRLDKSNDNKSWIFTDSLSWVKDKHSLKFGGGFVAQKGIEPTQVTSADQYGNFYFGGTPQFTGVGWADFLLGIPYQTKYDNVTADEIFLTKTWNLFAQDQWNITPRLTLTYGLRYEYNPGMYDRNGLFANFDATVAKSGRFIYPDGTAKNLNQAWLQGVNACDPDGINYTNSAVLNGAPCTPVITASQAGLPKGLRPTTKDRLMPRFGFAYRLTNDNKWVVRGGFGMYTQYVSGDPVDDGMGLLLQAGYNTYTNGYQGGGTFGTPNFQWPQIYAGSGTAGNTASPGGADINAVASTKWVDPYTEQWTLSVDHDFGAGYGARLSYIGSASRHLQWTPDENTLPYSNTTPAYNQPLSARAFPNLGHVEVFETGANAYYNGLQLDVSRRYQSGFGFDSTFTWQKMLTDQAGADGHIPEDYGDQATYYLNRSLDYGNLLGPKRLTWKTSALYDLPVGRGKMFGGSMPRLLDTLVGGWTLANIFEWDSGYFLTISDGTGNDPSGTGSGICSSAAGWNGNCVAQRPDRVASQSVKASHPTPAQWLNPAAYACPGDPNWQPGYGCYTGNAPGTTTTFNGTTYTGMELVNGNLYPIPGPLARFGNVKPGTVMGPGYVNLNSGLSKTFSLGERFRLRAEGTFTNILNHTQYDGTSMTTSVTSRSYGYIKSAIAPRGGQVSMRLTF